MTRLTDLKNVQTWLTEPLTESVESSLVRLACQADVVRMAVMPDVHLSGDVCVGVALATSDLIYPAAVGGDIGCGMLALRFQGEADRLDDEVAAARLLAGLYRRVPALKHSSATSARHIPPELADAPLSHPVLEKLKARDARLQLGTLGRGNHFVEFQADEADQLWIMIHSGSRGAGQAITAHHLRVAIQQRPGNDLAALDAGTDAGRAYLQDQEWARQYARCNRLAMLEAGVELVREVLGFEADRESLIHSDHNHVRREVHEGSSVWVHRKGALSAVADEVGVIPGSMGTSSFHVAGRGNPQSLCSSSHGAGRVLSRTDAAHAISTSQVRREMRDVWFDESRTAEYRDESPAAYRDIRRVMEAQRTLCRILRTLRPVLNYKH